MLQRADLAIESAGEGTLFVAEEDRFDGVGGKAADVDDA